MKKPFLLPILSTLLLLCSCGGNNNDSANDEIEKIVQAINDRCPLPAGEVGEMSGAEYIDGNVVVTMSMNEDYFNIEALQDNPELFKASIKTSFNNPTDDIKVLLEGLQKGNAGLTYVYVGKDSHKKVSVSFSKEEIQEIGKADADPDAMLDVQIAITNAQLPIQIDNMTIMTELVREGNAVVYIYDVDESLFSLSDIESSRAEVESALLTQLRQQRYESATEVFLTACHKANADIVYRYKGSQSGKTVEFRVAIADVFAL